MPRTTLPMRRVLQTWWPLALSWLLMGLELPALSAVVARLADPKINLAAYGGVVFPLALIVESPIIMLLAASTALSRDWDSYLKLRRFMMRAGALLTALHVLVVVTPLYYVVVVGLLGAPAEIVEPARVGLAIMTPWTWAIAYRRFNQGVLIRFGYSRSVGLGTMVRLGSNASVLVIGYVLGNVPGIVVATSAIAVGVMSEALYVGWRVRPVLRFQLKPAPVIATPLTTRAFVEFYVPLAMTSLLMLLVQPIGSAALSRMPSALESLAVWPVVSGLVFLLRGVGIAYNEVVVALLDEPGAVANLRRFAAILASLVTVALLIVAVTPLAGFWLEGVSALSPALAALAYLGLWIALPLPGLSVLQSWYQGTLVHSRHTRGVTEAVGIYLVVCSVVLVAGVVWGQVTGLYVGLAAYDLAMLVQTIWLWWRSRPAVQAVQDRDRVGDLVQATSPSAHQTL